jgi:tetratricopeptide (TPR) repeat protein
MSHIKLGALVAVAIGLSLAGLAHAQAQNPLDPLSRGLWTRPDYDRIYAADRVEEFNRRELGILHKAATAALNAKDFVAAETTLGELAGRDPTTIDAHFLMGLAKTGLGKWDEASTWLEAAVQKEPERPEPRTRLGLAYLKLGNVEAAKQQRAELASLDAACKRACADAVWIADGLVMLDQGLTGPRAPVLAASAAPLSPSAIASTVNFDPEKYSLVTFTDTSDLYELLTRDGRCVPKKLAEPRQPCALILYRPDDGATGGLSANFKPVFRVDSRASVWAIHDKKLQKVRIENLYFDVQQIIGQKQAIYRSVALIGNAENKANCDSGLPCLSSLVAEDMFGMYGKMPDSVVEVIWGAGMKDPGATRVQ